MSQAGKIIPFPRSQAKPVAKPLPEPPASVTKPPKAKDNPRVVRQPRTMELTPEEQWLINRTRAIFYKDYDLYRRIYSDVLMRAYAIGLTS